MWWKSCVGPGGSHGPPLPGHSSIPHLEGRVSAGLGVRVRPQWRQQCPIPWLCWAHISGGTSHQPPVGPRLLLHCAGCHPEIRNLISPGLGVAPAALSPKCKGANVLGDREGRWRSTRQCCGSLLQQRVQQQLAQVCVQCSQGPGLPVIAGGTPCAGMSAASLSWGEGWRLAPRALTMPAGRDINLCWEQRQRQGCADSAGCATTMGLHRILCRPCLGGWGWDPPTRSLRGLVAVSAPRYQGHASPGMPSPCKEVDTMCRRAVPPRLPLCTTARPLQQRSAGYTIACYTAAEHWPLHRLWRCWGAFISGHQLARIWCQKGVAYGKRVAASIHPATAPGEHLAVWCRGAGICRQADSQRACRVWERGGAGVSTPGEL